MSTDMSTDDPGDLFIVHEAADAGDVEALRQLLEERTHALEQRRQQLLQAGEDDVAVLGPELDHYIQGKDQNECTPLHIAILRGHVDCARCLVEAGADVQAECDGCPSLILAVSTAMLPGRHTAALELVQLLLGAGADAMQRDDGSRLALHWSAELGLVEVSQVLLKETAAAAAALREQMEAAGETADSFAPLNVLQIQDMHGFNPLHCAARNNQAAVLAVLLEAAAATAATAAATAGAEAAGDAGGDSPVVAKNKDGFTPLSLAAYHGAAAACELLLKAHPPAAGQQDRHGFNPATLAARRGFTDVAAQLQAAAEAAGVSAGAVSEVAPAAPAAGRAPTLIVAPPQCEKHLTCPDPLPRGVCPPPENVERLRVLVEPGRGILRGDRLAQLLAWELNVAPAPISDILRVHDWNYVRKLQAVCHSLQDRPEEQGYLDADTAVSFHTFEVALRAAAAVCLAVDRVVCGQAANAFCAVRPPGHHAGPRGVVPSKKDPTGSHGFCLLNNLAIGAAYAMNVHRHKGIQRVALLDFDVHHGNGTRACVSNTAPGKLQVPFSTPMSEGVHIYNTYQPWFDTDDDDNILFASVQGYGPKSSARPDVFVYPGSGATTDTHVLKTQRAAQQAGQLAASSAAPADSAAGDGAAEQSAPVMNGTAGVKAEEGGADGSDPPPCSSLVEEDPDHEFPPTTADDPPLSGPRLIEVGIKGPGAHPTLWRRAWRDKILPAVVNFNPDLILVSAGFDAHRKDVINYRYIGVTEADYEWLTDQIVQVANRCCKGRVVSVLEGGYNINGGIASAFARSVEAHVRGLAEPHSQAWDPTEPRLEREAEHRRKEERARRLAEKKAAAQARLARMEAAEAAAAAAAGAAGDAGGGVAAEADGAAADGGGRMKRRRTASVDYQALNAQLEAAAAAARSAVGADAPACAEVDGHN